ncbi:hypothetical protein HMPREF9412_5728 [Paenibacillus sp. HGF5]|nr:hypothetical protein HMPREF9412_5728 [Paenibacillus sp. HGF5]
MSLYDIFTEGLKKQPIHVDRLFVFELTSYRWTNTAYTDQCERFL